MSLLNKSRLPAIQKVVYVKKAISRLKLQFNAAQLISLRLNHVDAAKIACEYSIPLEVSQMKGITISDFVKVAKYINVTCDDVFKCFDIATDRVYILHRLNMKVDITFLIGRIASITDDMLFYKDVLDRKPTRQEINGFCELNRVGIEMYAQSCRSHGYEPIFEDAIKTISPFANPIRVYWDCNHANVNVESKFLLDRNAPVGILVRHMLTTADPTIYYHTLSHYVYGYTILDFVFAKRCIRRIQSFFRFCKRQRAAVKIQRMWKKSVSDPSFMFTKKRLMREFDEML